MVANSLFCRIAAFAYLWYCILELVFDAMFGIKVGGKVEVHSRFYSTYCTVERWIGGKLGMVFIAHGAVNVPGALEFAILFVFSIIAFTVSSIIGCVSLRA
ncbi:hypothetical protein BC940DRAFT_306575 [Gongronella butleri]|nr:hypothetical protein BC940DRAFT_306575 [Gongronella butleri]